MAQHEKTAQYDVMFYDSEVYTEFYSNYGKYMSRFD